MTHTRIWTPSNFVGVIATVGAIVFACVVLIKKDTALPTEGRRMMSPADCAEMAERDKRNAADTAFAHATRTYDDKAIQAFVDTHLDNRERDVEEGKFVRDMHNC